MRFDVCAHSYDEHSEPQRFFAGRVAEFILGSGTGTPSVCSNSGGETHGWDARATTILELGAGTGALTRHLCSLGATNSDSARLLVHATDASSAMVQFGRAAAPLATWSVLDAFTQPLPLAALQVSSGLLHWASDPVAMLARWESFLALGGRMVHAVPCDPCLAEWRALVPESPVPWRSEATWLEIYERAGLRVRCVQQWQQKAVYASALEMLRGLHRSGVTGRVKIGPVRLRTALRQYDERQRVPGGVLATWAWLAVEAVPI